jgi:hypothetical protein
VDRSKLKKGVPEYTVDYSHLIGRLDIEAVLEDLGVDFAFNLGPNQMMCHCPNLEGNHRNGDANPSFGFKRDKLVYNCFLCGGGNVVDLVRMMVPGQTQEEAVKYLEKFADFNISQEDFLNKIQQILHEEEQETTMPEYPPDALFQYRKIHPYLLERGITRETIIEMQVGYDEEHEGIVFPHFFMGKLVGWQTRHLRQDEDGTFRCNFCESGAAKGVYANRKVAKYKNTVGFPKANTLYGYDAMKQAISEEDRSTAIVVESPMSALKLKSLGFNRVTASFGQFSKEQAMLLTPIEKVYYWPDNDGAGYENAKKAIEFLAKFVDLWIVPVLSQEKGDAGDLDTDEQVLRHLSESYPASLFELFSGSSLLALPEH